MGASESIISLLRILNSERIRDGVVVWGEGGDEGERPAVYQEVTTNKHYHGN